MIEKRFATGDLVKYSEFYGVVYKTSHGNMCKVHWINNVPTLDAWVYQDQICEVTLPPSNHLWMNSTELTKQN